jgi:hypothetical protein
MNARSIFNSLALFSAAFSLIAVPCHAQAPDTLKESISAPYFGMQPAGESGHSVAIDANYIVVSAYNVRGAVKVFERSTGNLLHLIMYPDSSFGYDVAVAGDLVVVTATRLVYVYDLSSPAPTVPTLTLTLPASEVAMSVAISGKRLVVGSPASYAFTQHGPTWGAAYVYDLGGATPMVPTVTLRSTLWAGTQDLIRSFFGMDVAIDGTRIAVGAPTDYLGTVQVGKVHVYEMTGSNPTVPMQTLTNPEPGEGDQFGESVAVSGTLVAVGTPRDADQSGATYVYDLAGTSPASPIATLNNPTPAQYDRFGDSVAITGQRVVVGAISDDSGGVDAGIAYVYDLSSAAPSSPVVTLNNPGAPGDHFGTAVAVFGEHAVVGAPRNNAMGSSAGTAYAYDLSSENPGVPSITLNTAIPKGGEFGDRMGMAGGRLAIAIGNGAIFGNAKWRTYFYDLTSTTSSTPYFILDAPSAISIALSPNHLVMGIPNDSTNANNAGVVHVYNLVSGIPSGFPLILNSPDPVESDWFGTNVAISNSYVVVSKHHNNTDPEKPDRIYAYDLASSTPTVPIATLNNPEANHNVALYFTVAVSGSRVVVGAPTSNLGGTSSGRAYVYDLTGAAPGTPIATIENPSPAPGDSFGSSVAVSGTNVVIGCPSDNTSGTDAGSAYVYNIPTAGVPVLVATLLNPTANRAYFGTSVAISGASVVVGADEENSGAPKAGIAYLYDVDGATPTVPMAILNNPNPANDDRFGSYVAMDAGRIAVGAPLDDTTFLDSGAAYVFGPEDDDADNDGLLDLWEYARFGSTMGHSALDDFDGDGRSELLELGLNSDPTMPDGPAGTQVFNEGGYLTVTLNKRAGVNYLVESGDAPTAAAFSAATTTVVTNNATTLKVRDNVLIAEAPKRLVRVKVTAAP